MDKNSRRNQKIRFWTARILTIFLTVFFIFFTISVSWMNYSTIEIELALFASIILTVFLMINLLISWKWETVGGFIYLALSYFFAFSRNIFDYFIIGIFFPGKSFDFNSQILLPFFYSSVPLVIIGFLFLLPFIQSVLHDAKNIRRGIQ